LGVGVLDLEREVLHDELDEVYVVRLASRAALQKSTLTNFLL
jgi:hypothetical protein